MQVESPELSESSECYGKEVISSSPDALYFSFHSTLLLLGLYVQLLLFKPPHSAEQPSCTTAPLEDGGGLKCGKVQIEYRRPHPSWNLLQVCPPRLTRDALDIFPARSTNYIENHIQLQHRVQAPNKSSSFNTT
jgi:hypothetical protein